MTDRRLDFYKHVVADIINDRAASVLVIGGTDRDAGVLSELGFSDALITNLDIGQPAHDDARFQMALQDAESLTYPDASFDFVVAHEVLHHCHSPHRALLEAYRVARRGVLAIEARDSALMQLLVRLHVAQAYERAAVIAHSGESGGVRDSDVPNFVFRWTEREVEKTIQAFAPHARHRFSYRYGYDAPATAGSASAGGAKRVLMALALPFYRALVLALPRQQNLFAFAVWKPELPVDLQPWLSWRDGRPAFNADRTDARRKPRRPSTG